MCFFSTRHGRLIPHALPATGTSLPLGRSVFLASFRGPTVAPSRGAKALPPRLRRAVLAAVPAAPALAPQAQLEADPATGAASASELHSLGRVGTRQRPRACASSRPRQRGSTPLGDPVAAGSPVSLAQRRSVRPRRCPRHFSAYATALITPGSGAAEGGRFLASTTRPFLESASEQMIVPRQLHEITAVAVQSEPETKIELG
jgi:hypothetical protein